MVPTFEGYALGESAWQHCSWSLDSLGSSGPVNVINNGHECNNGCDRNNGCECNNGCERNNGCE